MIRKLLFILIWEMNETRISRDRADERGFQNKIAR